MVSGGMLIAPRDVLIQNQVAERPSRRSSERTKSRPLTAVGCVVRASTRTGINRLTEPVGSEPEPTGSWAEIFRGRNGLYTLILNLGMLLFAINQFVVATVMPTVVADLGGVVYYTWAFSLFAVGAIIGAGSAGPLREAFGVRPTYAAAGLTLAVGLAGSALAADMPTMVGFRLVQGLGGGAVASHAYGLVATIFPQQLRSRVLMVVSTVWGVATAGGPAYGAVFAETHLWPWAFWTLTPFAVIFACLAWRYIEGSTGHGRLSQIPYWRLALFALAVLMLSVTSLFDEVWIVGALVIAAVIVTAIAFQRDRRSERRIFPRQTIAIATELGATCWIFFFVSMVMAFVNTFTTFYLQALHGVAPLAAGYLFACQSFMWTAAAFVVASVPPAREPLAIVAGLMLLVIASLGVAFTVEPGPVVLIAVFIGLSGVGIGFLNNPAVQRIIAVAPEEERQMAGTSVQAIRNIGIAFGAAAAGMVAAVAGLVDGAPRPVVANAMEWVFGVNVMFALAALAIGIRMLLRQRPTTVRG